MPRFAANTAYLFSDRPLIERFGAAAKAGFAAVEGQFPYDTPPSAVKAELERHNLTMLGINTERGGEGLFGACRDAGARARFRRADQAIARLHHRDRRQRDPCARRQSAGRTSGPAAERVYIANLMRAADLAAENEHHAPDRADQSARPAGLFPQPRRACRRHHRQGGQAEHQDPVRFLSCADRGRRSDEALREASAAGRPCADRGGAVAARAGRGRGELSRRSTPCSMRSATRAGSRPNIFRAAKTEDGLGWLRAAR